MKESFKEFCQNLKKFFANTVYIKDLNQNKPIDLSVREIKIDGDYLYLDGKKIKLSNLSENHIIIINGSVEKVENCKNVFISEDVNLINNVENVICNNIEGDVFADRIQANDISGNITCEGIDCKNVDGNIQSQGIVKCQNVSEYVFSNGNVLVERGNIEGNVEGNNISVIGDIEGNVICKGDLTQKGNIEGDFYESFTN